MTTYTESVRPLEAVLYETPELSRTSVTIPSGTAAFNANAVIGYRRTAAATGTATTAGTGDFVANSVDADATSQAGTYNLVALSSTKALLYAPDGAFLGQYIIGDTYDANGITFDTEGVWAAGDTATIVVTHTEVIGLYNGTGSAIGIALYAVDASSDDVSVATLIRLAAVKASALTWMTGLTTQKKNTALAELAVQHLIARS